MMDNKHFCGRTRREFLGEAGAGFTGLALTGMLSGDGFLVMPPMLLDRRRLGGDRLRRSRR